MKRRHRSAQGIKLWSLAAAATAIFVATGPATAADWTPAELDTNSVTAWYGAADGGDSMRVANFKTNFVQNTPFTIFMVTLADNAAFGPTPNNRAGGVPPFYPRRWGIRYDTADIAAGSLYSDLEITAFRQIQPNFTAIGQT
jgi:hypothetical protein